MKLSSSKRKILILNSSISVQCLISMSHESIVFKDNFIIPFPSLQKTVFISKVKTIIINSIY